MSLKILSGGAANGLVDALAPAFKDKTGLEIVGDYGAVGVMYDRIVAGEQIDIAILSRKLIDKLNAEGFVDAATITDVGEVVTGIAVRDDQTAPDVSDGDKLRAALLAADSIYIPDHIKSTAGIHFAGVMKALGIFETVEVKLKPFPNGQTAMHAMAGCTEANPIGCTQVTEILNTAGVSYAGDLPAPHGLATTYTGVVCKASAQADAVKILLAMLTAPENEAVRKKAGFS